MYECPACRLSRAPLDEEMRIGPHEQMTAGIVAKVAYAVAQDSFVQAAEDLRRLSDLTVSPAECARVAEAEGRRVDERQREHEEHWAEPVESSRPVAAPEIVCDRLVIESDATCVLTVAGEEHKSVYCGTAFALESRARKDGSQRPLIGERRYTASALDFEDFSDRLQGLANRMGARRARQIAFIGDGAPCLWKWVEEHLPRAVQIQDYWHACEHLSLLAVDLFGEGEKARTKAAAWADLLRHSRLNTILEALETERRRRRGRKRQRLLQEIHYFETSRHRMDYARFEADGWPIGSGAIEGTCKHLVKERFCVTGARWRRANIPHVLALRLSLFNKEWESDWEEREIA